MTLESEKPGYILCAMNDPTGRRGLWMRATPDPPGFGGVPVQRIELCAGREGDDYCVSIAIGDTIDGEKLSILYDALDVGRWMLEDEGARAYPRGMSLPSVAAHRKSFLQARGATPEEIDESLASDERYEAAEVARLSALCGRLRAHASDLSVAVQTGADIRPAPRRSPERSRRGARVVDSSIATGGTTVGDGEEVAE